MKCPTCNEILKSITNLIEGIDYFYCQTCKTHHRYLLIGKVKR